MVDVIAKKATNFIGGSSGSIQKDTSSSNGLLPSRFELGKLLGHGTFAKGGLVAHIKLEISILRRVGHPNIVQLFEVMATKTKIYVMEYVRGGELFNKVAKGRLKEEIARKYF